MLMVEALKPLGFIQQRPARQLRARTAAIGDLERIRRRALAQALATATTQPDAIPVLSSCSGQFLRGNLAR